MTLPTRVDAAERARVSKRRDEFRASEVSSANGQSPRAGHAADILLLSVALMIAGGYLVMGVGNVMDDWFALYQGRVFGALRAAGPDQMEARPLGAMVYAFVFGVSGRVIAPTVLLMALSNAGSAMLIRRLTSRFLPGSAATTVALLWLALPTVTSIEVWASAANISLALLLALASVWLAACGRASVRVALLAGLFAGCAVLAYEAVVVLLAASALVLLLFDRLRWGPACLASLTGAAVGFAWVLTHWHPNKRITAMWGDVEQVIPANLTWGIAPSPIGYGIGVVVLVVTAVSFSPLATRRGLRALRRAFGIGWGVMFVGVLPFLKYTYAPVGAGDRVNVVSSIGGALVLGTTLHGVLGGRRRFMLVGATALLLLSLSPRVLLMRSWSLAAKDAEQILVEVQRVAHPGDLVVLGPSRIDRNGVTAMQHPDIFENAVRLTLDDETVRGVFPELPGTFDEMSGVKVDLRRIIPDQDAPGKL